MPLKQSERETTLIAYQLIRRGRNRGDRRFTGFGDQIDSPLYEIALMEKTISGCNYGSGDARVDLTICLSFINPGGFIWSS